MSTTFKLAPKWRNHPAYKAGYNAAGKDILVSEILPDSAPRLDKAIALAGFNEARGGTYFACMAEEYKIKLSQ